MDLVCPSCQKRLMIEDRYAGMVVKCPLCGSMLQAPVLLTAPPVPAFAATPGAPSPPDAHSAAPTMPALELPPSSSPTPLPPHHASGPMPEIFVAPPVTVEPPLPVVDHPEVLPDQSEVPTVRQGEYTTKIRFHLRPEILSWITPSCVVLLFFLSFFTWYHLEADSRNLWQLGFGERGTALFVFYIVFLVFVAQPLAILTLSFEQRWIPLPVGLRPVWPWRSLIVGGAVTLPFIFLLAEYVAYHFQVFGNPTSIAMKLAFRVHLLAVVASALQFWVEQRKAKNAPLPRLELRW